MIVLSIIIPVYNVQDYLDKCLSSLLDNNNTDQVEIILVDDCATDNSRSIAEAYVSKEPSLFKLITHQKNGGLSAARNTGVSHCQGKYITFVDSDDWLEANALDELLDVIEQEKSELILFDHERVYDDRSEFSKFDASKNTVTHLDPIDNANILIKMSLNAWSKVFLKSKYDGFSFPEGVVFEDLAVIPAIVATCEKITYIPKPLYKYLQREGSLVSTFVTHPEKIFPAMECLYLHYQNTKNSVFEYISLRELIIYQSRSLYTSHGSNELALSVLKTNINWMNHHYPNWRNNQHLKATKKGSILSFILKLTSLKLGRVLFLTAVSYDKIIKKYKSR